MTEQAPEVQHYPLNFDSLRKGHSWTPEELEQLTGKTKGTDKYNLAVLAFKERIIEECRDRGREFTVAIVKGCLRILTDEESTVYNSKSIRAGFRRAKKSHRRLVRTVDISKLNPQQAKEHERNILVSGRMLLAAKKARIKALTAQPHVRKVPGLPVAAST